MCLAVLALHQVAGLPVLMAANRDEFHARPTAPAARWEGDGPAVYAGRDLLAGGSWMGVTETGRYAVVTNFRDPSTQMADAPSRGALVEAYLRGTDSPSGYLMAVAREGQRYNGFNLIVGDAHEAWYYGNRGAAPHELPPGVYALSNHLLDTPWPKLARLKAAFTEVIARAPQPDLPALYGALADRSPAADSELPDTGVGLERERMLSSPFIVSPHYGTRASSILALHADGRGELHERGFDPAGTASRDTDLAFHWKNRG
ncbi:Ser/Thr-rich protein T10 [Bordetella ansorpii]|uniref:Ser/Thr-rich protein T10 n=1 Tax=Bordetella ansorpii TaxID=288768 RepID=A0A157RA29_9BORD|nr:NRDE family protein [Bordetella ansorpii]SAI54941.1 Ser/Thr-rich protein T10 [Bordetella ansorpii]